MSDDKPVLFLDMDSTVRKGYDELGRFVNGPEDVEVFIQARVMMQKWHEDGGRIVTVSNQKGIGLGLVSAEKIQAAMVETNRQCGDVIDVMGWCPHKDPCLCRKPQIGMLVRGVQQLEEKYGETYPLHLMQMVGDRPEDEECARKAGIDFMWANIWRDLSRSVTT